MHCKKPGSETVAGEKHRSICGRRIDRSVINTVKSNRGSATEKMLLFASVLLLILVVSAGTYFTVKKVHKSPAAEIVSEKIENLKTTTSPSGDTAGTGAPKVYTANGDKYVALEFGTVYSGKIKRLPYLANQEFHVYTFKVTEPGEITVYLTGEKDDEGKALTGYFIDWMEGEKEVQGATTYYRPKSIIHGQYEPEPCQVEPGNYRLKVHNNSSRSAQEYTLRVEYKQSKAK